MRNRNGLGRCALTGRIAQARLGIARHFISLCIRNFGQNTTLLCSFPSGYNYLIRSYSSRAVAVALEIQPKWLDNLLSQHALPGVQSHDRGIERRITDDGVLAIELVRMLSTDLMVPIRRAVEVVRALPDGATVNIRINEVLRLSIDIVTVQRRLRARLLSALEEMAVIRRGRPPRRPNLREE